jgi:hypothetical protein
LQTVNSSSIHRSLVLDVTRKVFSSWFYVCIAAVIATVFWIVFNTFDQLLFFSPVLAFYLPKDAVVDFILSNITAGLLGVVISMNIYALKQRHSLNNQGKKIGTTSTAASIFSGSSLGILSTACASCSSSLGFVLLSVLGSGLGVTVSTFLSNYQMPLRLVSVAILLWSCYSVSKSVAAESCSIVNNDTHNNKGNN